MGVDDFIKRIERYYGKYPVGRLDVVKQYLSKLSDNYRLHLYAEVVLAFSSRWGVAPDVAIFEEQKKAVWDKLDRDVRPQIEDKSEYVDKATLDGFWSTFAATLRQKRKEREAAKIAPKGL